MWCPKCQEHVITTTSTVKSPSSTEGKKYTRLVTVEHICTKCQSSLHTTTHKES